MTKAEKKAERLARERSTLEEVIRAQVTMLAQRFFTVLQSYSAAQAAHCAAQPQQQQPAPKPRAKPKAKPKARARR